MTEEEQFEEMVNCLVDAVSQGTKKFSYEEAPFLHQAMQKYFEWETGINLKDIE